MSSTVSGSSPRVRGTLCPASGRHHHHRFIPACAGNTIQSRWTAARRAVHPRVCGEHAATTAASAAASGSSPRVRGTRGPRRAVGGSRRFIPACAGNTLARADRVAVRMVHPRVCGEHASRKLILDGLRRFIPACAGNTIACRPRLSWRAVHPRVCGEHDHVTPLADGGDPVHPRVCGEHWTDGQAATDVDGSSPRVRGTPRRRVATQAVAPVHPRVCGEHVLVGSAMDGRGRFIPACAGNTPSTRWPRGATAVHPRVCGEHGAMRLSTSAANGSSPRVRGTRPASPSASAWRGFIPACAGNTRFSVRCSRTMTVHPRVCGEHRRRMAAAATDSRFIPACAGNTPGTNTPRGRRSGSSPRVRGTPRRPPRGPAPRTVHPRVCGEHARIALASAVISWFIPACAGNTPSLPAASRRSPVHPRVCGEHHPPAVVSNRAVGSSPRVRGTLEQALAPVFQRRFIPACAGNTPRSLQTSVGTPVHPRVCGEHTGWGRWISVTAGSSPRVRGTPGRRDARRARGRFIPACAGNTGTQWRAGVHLPVHPRVCGEHAALKALRGKTAGSSPRVRGTPR